MRVINRFTIITGAALVSWALALIGVFSICRMVVSVLIGGAS